MQAGGAISQQRAPLVDGPLHPRGHDCGGIVRDDAQAAVDEAGAILRSAFPIDGRTGLAALREGADPGGNVLLMVDWTRGMRARHASGG